MTTLTDGPCTLAARRQTLQSLARQCNERGPAAVALALSTVAHESLLPAELLEVFDSYCGHLALQDGINGIPGATEFDWRDINPDLKGPDLTGQARDEIDMRVKADEDLLLWGKR